ncbi:uncharacterized protein LOC143070801 [Mytilus galloprovincialis]|uniref:uncharacterized protein LOC143070801 n=1 Tax=Mytilus galloprovincialis TaxID=29158 RepID=UPI003F7BFD1A
MFKKELDFENISCQYHAGQYTCLYCKTCDTLICATCISKVHKKHDVTEIQEGYEMKIDKLKKEQSSIQKDRKQIVSGKEHLNQLLSSENYKYNQVFQNVRNHEKSVKEAVERYFKKLRDELDENHNTVSNSIKSDLNTVIDLLKQADDKKNVVQEIIQIKDASLFFVEVNKLETSICIQMPQPRLSHGSTPNFVPGEFTQSDIGVFKFDANVSHQPNIILEVNKQYQTELVAVEYVCSSNDHSFWIGSGNNDLVQSVKPDGPKLKIQSNYYTRVYGMAVTQSHNLLLCSVGSRLQEINTNTGTLTDSVYNMSPLEPTAVYITSDDKVLIGGVNKEFPMPGRRAVILMNQNGDHERVYEHDQNKQSIFTYPLKITSTSNGNIHVGDRVSLVRGRIVVLGQDGDIINIYTGHREINKVIPFYPGEVVKTPRENVIVADVENSTLHFLNIDGLLLTYYKTSDINIIFPWSLAFTPTGQLYIGCSAPAGSTTKDAKLYEVTISGC